MSGKIKGITLTVGGDTAGLRKELTKVNKETSLIQKELKEVERALKLDPKNTELLAQKQKLLADAIDSTEDKLKEMKKAQEKADQAIKDGTEISEKQYRLLQREISNTEAQLKDLKSQSEKTNDTLADVEKPKKGLKNLKETAVNTAKGLGVLTAAGTAVAAMLSEIEEETREYREDLNKLKTAFTTTGKPVESAKKSFYDFYAILGEDDRAVEAVNHLAELTNNEKELTDWTTIAAGVTAKFGDSLPIEGLTEAANETAKVGQVTGVLADALNWVGLSEDEFNEKLKQCNTEQERSALITETLKGAYQEAAGTYTEMNSAVIASREAQQQWNDAMAKVGELVAPIKAELISFGADYVKSLISISGETNILIDGIKKENEAYLESKAIREKKLESDIAEIDYTIRLYDELNKLVDANGRVLGSNQNRVNYILNELSEATGIELQLIGDQIKGYGDLSESVENALQKKRAEIILASQEEAFKTATLTIDEKLIEQEKLMTQIIEQKAKVAAAEAEDAKKRGNLAITTAETQKMVLQRLENAYKDNLEVIRQCYKDKNTYETNYENLLSGHAEKVKTINSSIAESYAKTGEADENELARRVEATATIYGELLTEVANGNKEISEQEVADAKARYDQAIKDYEEIGKAIPDGMKVGIGVGEPDLKTRVNQLTESIKKWVKTTFDINSPSGWGEDIGEFIDEGLANGIFDNIKLVKTSFKALFSAVEEEHENLTKEEEKYNSELERIRAAGTEDANKAYLERLKTLADEAKEKRKIIRDTYEGMVEDVQKSIDTIEKDMQSYQKGLSSVDLTETKDETIMIFNGKEIKKKVTNLADLSQERKELEHFLENILNLREIGIDDSMIEQIKALGGEKGGLLAQALLDATPEQREQFLNDFETIGKLSGQVTAEVYKEEMQSAADSTKALFEELNPDFLKIGEDWGTILGEGIITKLNGALQNIKNIMNSIDFNYNIPTGSSNGGTSGGKTVVYNTSINQTIGPNQSQSAFEISEETRRTMENLSNLAVLS